MIKKISLIVFALMLIVSAIPFAVSATDIGEILELRTEFSKTYKVANTTLNGKAAIQYSTVVGLAPLHYKDNYSNKSEQWKDIDTTIVNGQITKAPYTASIDYVNKIITIIDKRTNDYTILALTATPNGKDKIGVGTVSGNKVTFASDFTVEAGANGLYIQAPHNASFNVIKNKPINNLKIAHTADGSITTNDDMDKQQQNYQITVGSALNISVAATNDMSRLYNASGTWTFAINTGGAIGTYDATVAKSGNYMRFLNVTITSGSTIDSAVIRCYASSSASTGTVVARVTGYDVDDAGQLTSIASYKAARGTIVGGANNNYITTAYTSWSVGSWTSGTSYDSADCKSVVQEIIDRGGWSSGNDIGLWLDDHNGESSGSTPYRSFHSYYSDSTHPPQLRITYTSPAAPTVTTQATSSVQATTATGNGTITDGGTAAVTRRGVCYSSVNNPPTTADSVVYEDSAGFGNGAYTESITSLSTGTTYYLRAYAVNSVGTAYGAVDTFLTKPAAPTNVAATDGTHTDKVVVTWTKSTGATGYKVYEGANLLDTLGDVATFDDNTAAAPTITAGTASASDGTSAVHVVLSIAGESANNGTTRTYKVVALNATGDSADSATDTGYRGVGALTYQWQRSAADSDAAYGDIVGATTDPYNDAAGEVDPDGRYYKCVLDATGAAQQTTNADRGYIAGAMPPIVTTGVCSGFTQYAAVVNGIMSDNNAFTVTKYGFDYGLTDAYGSSVETNVTSMANGTPFWMNLTGLLPATVYHYRAKAYTTEGWGYGSDAQFSTKGSPVQYEVLATGQDDDSDPIYGNNWGYMQFTVGSISHTATSINLYIKRTLLPGTVTVSLKHGSGGVPTGNDLVSTTFDGDAISTAYSWYSFPITETSLQAGQQYAIVVRAIAGDVSNYIEWGTDAGGGLANAISGASVNGGLTYTAEATADALFAIWGNPSIEVMSAKVYRSYIQSNDWLIVADVNNIYEPYYPNGDSAQHFQLQLIDGATIKAATIFRAWQRQPLAIYVNASTASSLTWGDITNYKIRIQNIDSAAVYQEYALVAADWQSGGMAYLDNQVRTLASVYQDYYSTTYLTNITGKTYTVLNESGSIVFIRGIDSLHTVRPNLFYTTFSVSKNADGTHTIFEPDWSTALGTQFSGAVSEFASLFGASSPDALAWIFIFIGLFIGLAAVGIGHGIAGMVLGSFFIIPAGFVFGGISIAVIGVIGFVFIMLISIWIAKVVFNL